MAQKVGLIQYTKTKVKNLFLPFVSNRTTVTVKSGLDNDHNSYKESKYSASSNSIRNGREPDNNVRYIMNGKEIYKSDPEYEMFKVKMDSVGKMGVEMDEAFERLSKTMKDMWK